MPARRFLVVPILVAAFAAAGCGGGDSNSSGSKTDLQIAQANADVNEFCAVSGSNGAIYDVAYFAMLDAVDTLQNAYRDHRNDKVNLDQRNHGVPVDKVVRDAVAQLSKSCGKDGKQQAAKLQLALKQQ